jgi:hypothetical protein
MELRAAKREKVLWGGVPWGGKRVLRGVAQARQRDASILIAAA